MGRKEKNNKKIIWAVFIALVMIMSVLSFALPRGDDSNASSYKYNDYEFKKAEGDWVLYLNDVYYKFDYLPEEVKNISFDPFSINSSKIYVAYVPKDRDVSMDYSINKLFYLFGSLGVMPRLACIEEEGCPDIPLVDCNNKASVIY
jgi:hypothetical protein